MSQTKTSPDRKAGRKINQLQQQLFNEGVVSRKLLDSVPSPLLIIDEHWRVVYANGAVLSLVGGTPSNPRPGLREGDAFHCVHRQRPSQSPGPYHSCQVCGVARALSRSLKGEPVSEDCRVSCDLSVSATSLDLHVWATPLEFRGDHFSILTLVDISDKRRRELLEATCYHDLLNTLTSIRGVLSVLKDEDVKDRSEIFTLLERMTQDSIDEINTLRLLETAEQGELTPRWEVLKTGDFLRIMRQTIHRHPAAEGKQLAIGQNAADLPVVSDYQLLRRVFTNMLINALEATDAAGTVAMGCSPEHGGVRFWVHNAGAVPPEIQPRIFQRATTTKGHNRGTGTYSIRLLGAVLGGKTFFTSSVSDGTTFSLWLPDLVMPPGEGPTPTL